MRPMLLAAAIAMSLATHAMPAAAQNSCPYLSLGNIETRPIATTGPQAGGLRYYIQVINRRPLSLTTQLMVHPLNGFVPAPPRSERFLGSQTRNLAIGLGPDSMRPSRDALVGAVHLTCP